MVRGCRRESTPECGAFTPTADRPGPIHTRHLPGNNAKPVPAGRYGAARGINDLNGGLSATGMLFSGHRERCHEAVCPAYGDSAERSNRRRVAGNRPGSSGQKRMFVADAHIRPMPKNRDMNGPKMSPAYPAPNRAVKFEEPVVRAKFDINLYHQGYY